jgi:hypothetical protein
MVRATRETSMQPYDRLTILRNRFRARDLRIFRERVQAYFQQVEYDAEDALVDWDSLRAARAEINRMLPRVVQIVQAADLGGAIAVSSRNPAGRAVEILQNIFADRYSHGAYQEVLDVLDMALGVYDASRYGALTRTINPFHYVAVALGFVAGLPRRALVAIGLLRPRSAKVRPDAAARLEAALERLTGTEELIETRFAEMREWQSRRFGEHADQVNDLAERIDFLERVLAQQRPAKQLEPGERKKATPA